MSRLLSTVALGAALALTASACTNAGAEGTGTAGGESETAKPDGGGHGDLYYVSMEQTGDYSYTSKLLRWDGSEGGEIETVAETQDGRMYYSATVSSDGAFAAYAEGDEDGMLQVLDLKTTKTKGVVEYPKGIDSCLTPAFAPGTGHELLVPDFNEEVTVHYPDDTEVGNVYAIPDCMPQPAIAEGDDEPSIYYVDRDRDKIMFMKPDREAVDSGLGTEAMKFLDTDRLHELSAVSPTGSQVCVTRTNPDSPNPNRTGACQALFDVATGEIVKHFDGADFTVRYNSKGLMLRKDGELSYFDAADDLGEPAETLTEPEELAEAELIAVTDA